MFAGIFAISALTFPASARTSRSIAELDSTLIIHLKPHCYNHSQVVMQQISVDEPFTLLFELSENFG